MPKFGSTATGRPQGTAAPSYRSTGGSGGFLKQPALVGELVIVKPVALKLGKFNEGKPDERETRQLEADVVVLTGPHKGEYPGLYLSGRPIVDAGVEILDEKADTVLLGRMTRKPLKKYKDHWPTPEDLEKAIADPAVVVPNNCYSWIIPEPSTADTQIADAYYAGDVPDTDDEDDDPYAD
jgi:hypothetical protein